VKIAGKVVSGLGESAMFLSIPWVNEQLKEKLRFSPYCGTLNIAVSDAKIQRDLKEHHGDRITSAEKGFCDALLFRGMIAGIYPCGVIIPLVPHYPETIIEVVAPVHLKETLPIKDGDGIEVELSI
jgi:riboflavin kinase, archaea type